MNRKKSSGLRTVTGKFAVSKAGHDKDQCYVIVREDEDFVYLCDGALKTISNPKKKRKKHIQIINHTVSPDLLKKLCDAGNQNQVLVRDEEIKYEIKNYLKKS